MSKVHYGPLSGKTMWCAKNGEAFPVEVQELDHPGDTMMDHYVVKRLDGKNNLPTFAFPRQLFSTQEQAQKAVVPMADRKTEDEKNFRLFAARYRHDPVFAEWFDEQFDGLKAELQLEQDNER